MRSSVYSTSGAASGPSGTAGPEAEHTESFVSRSGSLRGSRQGCERKEPNGKELAPLGVSLSPSSLGGAQASVSGPPRPRGQIETHLQVLGEGFGVALLGIWEQTLHPKGLGVGKR